MDGVERGGKEDEWKKKNWLGLQMLQTTMCKCKSAPSHHLHRQSPARLHPGWGSPSRNKDSGSEDYRWRCASFSANHRAKPGDSYNWRDLPEGCWRTKRGVGSADSLVCVFWDICICMAVYVSTHSVDRECSVSKAPGFMEVIWLS